MSGSLPRTIASAITGGWDHGQAHEPRSSHAQEHAEDRKEVAATGEAEGKTAANRQSGGPELARRTVSVPPTDEEITTDAVIDAIALIEAQRQDLKREPDPEAWRKRALGVLGELLGRIEEASRLHGPSTERQANAEALRNAIGRVKGGGGPAARAGAARQRSPGEKPRDRQLQKPRPRFGGRRPAGRRP